MERPDTEFDPAGPRSHCDVSIIEGTPITLWAPPDVETKLHPIPNSPTQPLERIADEPHYVYERSHTLSGLQLGLHPGRLIVIGRSNGHRVPYLDPAYQATTIVPESGQSVLLGVNPECDTYVSRAHFTLRASAGGIIFTNGVPRNGGGIRPPTNWTDLLAPIYRRLAPCEEVPIECGNAILIRLPNRCVIRLGAQ
jgi:hypothetical protein